MLLGGGGVIRDQRACRMQGVGAGSTNNNGHSQQKKIKSRPVYGDGAAWHETNPIDRCHTGPNTGTPAVVAVERVCASPMMRELGRGGDVEVKNPPLTTISGRVGVAVRMTWVGSLSDVPKKDALQKERRRARLTRVTWPRRNPDDRRWAGSDSCAAAARGGVPP